MPISSLTRPARSSAATLTLVSLPPSGLAGSAPASRLVSAGEDEGIGTWPSRPWMALSSRPRQRSGGVTLPPWPPPALLPHGWRRCLKSHTPTSAGAQAVTSEGVRLDRGAAEVAPQVLTRRRRCSRNAPACRGRRGASPGSTGSWRRSTCARASPQMTGPHPQRMTAVHSEPGKETPTRSAP